MSKKRAETMPSRPVKHGIYSFLKSGKINPSIRGCKRLERYLRDIERDLIADLGGPENMTAAKELLVKSTIQAYGVLLLAGAYTQKYSILEPVKARRGILELQPVLGHQYIAFLNCVRQNLLALGLDRAPEREPSLTDIVAEIDREAAERASQGETGAGADVEGGDADPEGGDEAEEGGQGEGHE